MTRETSNNRSGKSTELKFMEDHVETGITKARFFSRVSPNLIEESFVNYLSQNSIEFKKTDDRYLIDLNYHLNLHETVENVTDDIAQV